MNLEIIYFCVPLIDFSGQEKLQSILKLKPFANKKNTLLHKNCCQMFLFRCPAKVESSVKWGHLGHFDPTPTNTISPTNPMGSSGTL